MPVWPFGRRRRNQEGPQAVAEEKVPTKGNVRTASPASPGTARKNSRKHSRRKRRKSSPHRDEARRSGDNRESERPTSDTQIINNDGPSEPSNPSQAIDDSKDLTALPGATNASQSPHLRPVTMRTAQIPYDFRLDAEHTESATSLPNGRHRGKLQRPQSLRRPESLIQRPKSTKRKADPVREEEIRAMSAPIAMKRPATYSAGMLRRETKKMKEGLNKNFERPTSEISVPFSDSIHSSMSGVSELKGFKISSFDVFSARPKLRYSSSVQIPASALQGPSPPATSRGESQNGKRPYSPRREEREKNRIGDRADDMDASTLRDVMERDARKRAKRKKLEEEKLKRKLERRAEKQRALDARAKEPRKDPETGAFERRPRPQDILSPTGVLAADPHSPLSAYRPVSSQRSYRPATSDSREIGDDAFYEASELPHDSAMMPDLYPPSFPSPSPIATPTEEPFLGTAQAIRYSKGSFGPPSPVVAKHNRNTSNISYLPDLASEAAPATAEPTESTSIPIESKKRRSSDVSSKRVGGWTAIFRRATFSRGKSGDQVKTSPSQPSFSNTSRESMSRQPLPSHLVQRTSTPPLPPRSASRASGVPVRTMSKFREDLPELPISPPGSRVQSPGFEQDGTPPLPPLSARRGIQAPATLDTGNEAVVENQLPTPEEEVYEQTMESPNRRENRESGLTTRSMASVDSEGSWLSGKPLKRGSRQRYGSGVSSRFHDASGSNDEVFETPYESSSEEQDVNEDIQDDEFYRHFSPTPNKRMSVASDAFNRKPSSNALGPSAAFEDEDQPQVPILPRPLSGDEVMHTGAAKTPTVVHHQPTARVKSSEGLVKFFAGGETARSSASNYTDGALEEAAESPPEEQAVTLERAKSIDLVRSHARQVSAGSAKLLDIKRSSSINMQPPLPPKAS